MRGRWEKGGEEEGEKVSGGVGGWVNPSDSPLPGGVGEGWAEIGARRGKKRAFATEG